jgi:hypothetical protein
MLIHEAERCEDDLAREALINDEENAEMRAFVLAKVRSFEGAPFTIQRLSILIVIQ